MEAVASGLHNMAFEYGHEDCFGAAKDVQACHGGLSTGIIHVQQEVS